MQNYIECLNNNTKEFAQTRLYSTHGHDKHKNVLFYCIEAAKGNHKIETYKN